MSAGMGHAATVTVCIMTSDGCNGSFVLKSLGNGRPVITLQNKLQ